MNYFFKKIILPVSGLIILSSCSAVAPNSLQTTFKYLGFAKGGVDAVTLSATGKTSNDHLLSYVVGKNCKISRLLRKQPICLELEPKVFKYKLFKKGKLVSTDNVVKMQFPSEVYDFNKTLKKHLTIIKKPKQTKTKTKIKSKEIF